jgi:glyoxylase-like metal-dependent hydrolase (beta-lactamase superfamily II)
MLTNDRKHRLGAAMRVQPFLYSLICLLTILGPRAQIGMAQQAPAAPAPIVQPQGLRQISPHIWAIPDNSVGGVSNIGFVVGTNATLVIDTGLGPRNGEIVLNEARKLAPANALYLVTTHIHPEHDLGAQAFPASAKMIRSEDEVKDIAHTGLSTAQLFSSRSPIMADLLKNAQFRQADITFDKDYSLDLGGIDVRIAAMGLNHTLGDTTIWVPSEGVLFGGDLAMAAAPLFAEPSASMRRWEATLVTLDALRPKIIVPSHGPIGDARYISSYHNYFATIQRRSGELKQQGKSADETVTILIPELSAMLPGAANRLDAAIRSAYREE